MLGALSDDAVRRMLVNGDLAAAVLGNTDRTPFAITEVVRELVARDAVVPEPGGGWTPRPPAAVTLAAQLSRAGQVAAVRNGTGRQTGVRAELLALLALLAREAPASTLAKAAGLEPRAVLDTLSGLAAAGLLRLGERGWATAHDLVAETVVADLDHGERGRLHALLAHALTEQDADPSEIARHHRDAGDTDAAAASFVRAADRALAAHATREAFALAEDGLALSSRPGTRADLLAVRAEAGSVHGEPDRGRGPACGDHIHTGRTPPVAPLVATGDARVRRPGPRTEHRSWPSSPSSPPPGTTPPVPSPWRPQRFST